MLETACAGQRIDGDTNIIMTILIGDVYSVLLKNEG